VGVHARRARLCPDVLKISESPRWFLHSRTAPSCERRRYRRGNICGRQFFSIPSEWIDRVRGGARLMRANQPVSVTARPTVANWIAGADLRTVEHMKMCGCSITQDVNDGVPFSQWCRRRKGPITQFGTLRFPTTRSDPRCAACKRKQLSEPTIVPISCPAIHGRIS